MLCNLRERFASLNGGEAMRWLEVIKQGPEVRAWLAFFERVPIAKEGRGRASKRRTLPGTCSISRVLLVFEGKEGGGIGRGLLSVLGRKKSGGTVVVAMDDSRVHDASTRTSSPSQPFIGASKYEGPNTVHAVHEG